jgi:hypothetical protein
VRMARVMVGHGMAGQNCCVVGGLLSLSLCRRGFQDLLMLCFIVYKYLYLKFIHLALTLLVYVPPRLTLPGSAFCQCSVFIC